MDAVNSVIASASNLWSGLPPRVQTVLTGVAGLFTVSFIYKFIQGFALKSRYAAIIRKKRTALEQERRAAEAALTVSVAPKLESEITALSAKQLVTALQDGKYTCEQVVTVYCRRALEVHDKTNCLTSFLFEDALESARAHDQQRKKGSKKELGPLFGLPVSIKEHLWIKGTDSTMGLAQLCFQPAEEDGAIVKTLKDLGAIPFCKTNNPQLLLAYESNNPVYGRTTNTWDSSRSPGGSSGGESALIAGGGSPLGVGTDIGGSVRVPCDFCGLYGLKPTPDILSLKGSTAPFEGFHSVNPAAGPMARHAEDITLFMQALTRGHPQRAHDAYCPPFDLQDPVSPKTKLRIGYYWDNGLMAASATKKRAVMEAKAALEKAGHELVEFKLPVDPRRYMVNYFGLMSPDGGRGLLEQLEGNVGDPAMKDMVTAIKIPQFIRTYLIGPLIRLAGFNYNADTLAAMNDKSGYDILKWQADKDNIRAEMAKAWSEQQIDALLCPPCNIPAPKHEDTGKMIDIGSNAMLWNLCDYPAGVVPVTTVEDGEEVYQHKMEGPALPFVQKTLEGSVGMPCGVQVVAQPYHEHIVLSLMEVLADAIRFENTVAQ